MKFKKLRKTILSTNRITLDITNNDKYLGIINDGEYIWHIIKSSGEKCHIMEEK